MTRGVLLAVISAVTFGMSGPFAKALLDAGWSSTAAVTARLIGGAVVMAIVATIIDREWLRSCVANWPVVVGYGLTGVAGTQLCYFNAIRYLPVGIALLLEYMAPILIIGWLWVTTHRRPTTLTIIGATVAILGALVVLEVFDSLSINPLGVAFAMCSALCLVCYFLLADKVSTRPTNHSHSENGEAARPLSPLSLTAGGLIVGAVIVTVVGVSGLMPMHANNNGIVISGTPLPTVVAIAVLALIATAIAYITGIFAVAYLKPTFAALIALGEVLSAVTGAWLFIGQSVTQIQILGGAILLIGIMIARLGERPSPLT